MGMRVPRQRSGDDRFCRCLHYFTHGERGTRDIQVSFIPNAPTKRDSATILFGALETLVPMHNELAACRPAPPVCDCSLSMAPGHRAGSI